jgi:hypothetical protein
MPDLTHAALLAALHDSSGPSPEVVHAIAEALERARVVAVLDGWGKACQQNESRIVSVSQCKDEVLDAFEDWFCDLQGTADTRRIFRAPTPDAARTAAALAIERGEV